MTLPEIREQLEQAQQLVADAYVLAQDLHSAQCFCFTSAPESLRRAAHEASRNGLNELIAKLGPIARPVLKAEYDEARRCAEAERAATLQPSPEPKEEGCDGCRRFVQALGGSTVRLYPDANFETYLDDITGSAVDAVNDAADGGDEHLSALLRQMTEAVGHLRRSRDELRRDMNRVALASIEDEESSPSPAPAQKEEQ